MLIDVSNSPIQHNFPPCVMLVLSENGAQQTSVLHGEGTELNGTVSNNILSATNIWHDTPRGPYHPWLQQHQSPWTSTRVSSCPWRLGRYRGNGKM